MYNDDINTIIKTTPVYLAKKSGVYRGNGKIKNTVGSDITSELLPFRGVMIKQLKRRGFDTSSMPFNIIVPLYFNEFVSNKNDANNFYQPVNCFEFAENPIFKFSVDDNLNGDVLAYKNRSYFTEVNNLVDATINHFRNSKLKKQSLVLSGSSNFDLAMTSDELMQANAAIKVENELKNKLDGTKPITVKDFKTLIIFVGIIWLLWYMTN